MVGAPRAPIDRRDEVPHEEGGVGSSPEASQPADLGAASDRARAGAPRESCPLSPSVAGAFTVEATMKARHARCGARGRRRSE